MHAPFAPLRLADLVIDPPVVLAPMAGVTNRAFRRLVREQLAAAGAEGNPILVSEMVNARGIVEGSLRSAQMTEFDGDETTRSIQLYGTEPEIIAEAVRIVIGRGANHVDLNFGCPVRKVTRHGGGAAIPARPRLLARIVDAAARAAAPHPLTVKMRVGLDGARLTHLEAARAAADHGASAVALHARTAEQMYSGEADWHHVAEVVEALDGSGVPVLGNGDVWSVDDARRLLTETGCAGVVVGRACLGRPWFFAELTRGLHGAAVPEPPTLGDVLDVMARHARMLAEHQAEPHAVLELRKHIGWYLTGYPVGGVARRRLLACETIAELDAQFETIDRTLTIPADQRNQPRGTRRGPYAVSIPQGWMDADADGAPEARDAELAVSGG